MECYVADTRSGAQGAGAAGCKACHKACISHTHTHTNKKGVKHPQLQKGVCPGGQAEEQGGEVQRQQRGAWLLGGIKRHLVHGKCGHISMCGPLVTSCCPPWHTSSNAHRRRCTASCGQRDQPATRGCSGQSTAAQMGEGEAGRSARLIRASGAHTDASAELARDSLS
jgi:hypothetical protein